jgi:hypothetical protein
MNPFLICTGSVAMDAVKHLLSQSLNHDLPLAKTYPNLRHLSYRSNTKNLLSPVDVIARVLPYHLDCQHKSASLSFIICIKDLFLLRPIFFLSGPTIVSLSLYNCCAHYLSVCPFLQFFPCFLHFSFCFVLFRPTSKRKSNARSQGPCRFLSNSAAMQFPAVWPCLARLPVWARITAPCWQRQMQWTHARTETRRRA